MQPRFWLSLAGPYEEHFDVIFVGSLSPVGHATIIGPAIPGLLSPLALPIGCIIGYSFVDDVPLIYSIATDLAQGQNIFPRKSKNLLASPGGANQIEPVWSLIEPDHSMTTLPEISPAFIAQEGFNLIFPQLSAQFFYA